LNKNKNKILIVGGGYADIPLILSAKKLGFHVITTGNQPNDLGHIHSDEYYNVDFSDNEAILKLAKELKISAICASCNDFSALSAAYTAEKLGLPGHDPYNISKRIHHKDKYREFAIQNNIPTPKAKGFIDINNALEEIKSFQMPVIIKPIDLSGGKGISVVNKIEEYKIALEKAFKFSKAKRIVIEEFIEGSRHGFSAFLYNKKVVFYFTDNEHYYLNPFLVSAASTPSLVSEKVEKKLSEISEKIANLLKLKDGIFHVQFILRNEEPVIIEICRRAPGDLYINLVKHATKIDYPLWIVKAASGQNCKALLHRKPKGYIIRHCIMSSKLGKIKNITFDESIKKNIIDKLLWWKKGDNVDDIMTSKFGIIFKI